MKATLNKPISLLLSVIMILTSFFLPTGVSISYGIEATDIPSPAAASTYASASTTTPNIILRYLGKASATDAAAITAATSIGTLSTAAPAQGEIVFYSVVLDNMNKLTALSNSAYESWPDESPRPNDDLDYADIQALGHGVHQAQFSLAYDSTKLKTYIGNDTSITDFSSYINALNTSLWSSSYSTGLQSSTEIDKTAADGSDVNLEGSFYVSDIATSNMKIVNLVAGPGGANHTASSSLREFSSSDEETLFVVAFEALSDLATEDVVVSPYYNENRAVIEYTDDDYNQGLAYKWYTTGDDSWPTQEMSTHFNFVYDASFQDIPTYTLTIDPNGGYWGDDSTASGATDALASASVEDPSAFDSTSDIGTLISGSGLSDTSGAPTPKYEHKTFKGWDIYIDSTDSGTDAASNTTLAAMITNFSGQSTAANVTYKAIWEDQVKISFNINGGTIEPSGTTIEDQWIDSGSTATAPTGFTSLVKGEEVLVGWSTSSSATDSTNDVSFGAGGTTFTRDTELFARFASQFRISLDPDGGEWTSGDTAVKNSGYITNPASFDLSVNGGDLSALTFPPTKTDYTLVGWNDGTDTAEYADINAVVNAFKGGSGNLSLKAVWKKTVTVTFAAGTNGSFPSGTTDTTITKYEGYALTATDKPSSDPTGNTHFTFAGWNDGTTDYTDTAALTGIVLGDSDITFTAKYTEDPKFKIVLQSDGGYWGSDNTDTADKSSAEVYVLSELASDATLTALSGPTKAGFALTGWKQGSNAAVADIAAVLAEVSAITTAPTVDTTYTYIAQWASEITVTYSAGDGAFATGTTNTTITKYEGYTMTASDVPSAMPTKANYTLSKWSDGTNEYAADLSDITSLTLGSSNVTITPVFTENAKYKIELDPTSGYWPNATDESDKTDTAKKESQESYTLSGLGSDATLSALSEPKRDNYTLIGWKHETDENVDDIAAVLSTVAAITPAPASDTTYTYTAQWAANRTITFDPNGGSFASGTTNTTITKYQGYTLTTSDKPSAEPTRENYVLSSWVYNGTTYAADLSDIADAGKEVTLAGSDISFVASWTENPKYSLSLDPDGGSWADSSTSVKSSTGAYYSFATLAALGANDDDTAIKSLANPTKTGYRFDGWQRGTGSKLADINAVLSDVSAITDTPTADTPYTYVAQWVKTYTVSFDAGDGGSFSTAPSPLTKDAGTTLSQSDKPTDPTKANYHLTGWSDGTNTYEADGSDFNTITVNGDITLTAQWEADPTFKLTLDPKSGSWADSTTTAKSTAGTYYSFTALSALASDSAIAALANPTRDGYKFAGWKHESDATVSNIAGSSDSVLAAVAAMTSTATTGEVEVVYEAQWIQLYTISFSAGAGSTTQASIDNVDIDDTTLKLNNQTTRTAVAALSEATPSDADAKYFLGWYTAATGGSEVDADTVLLASWDGDSDYTITLYAQYGDKIKISFDLNGGNISGSVADVIKYYIPSTGAKIPAADFPNTSDSSNTSTYVANANGVFKEWNTAEDGTGTAVATDGSLDLPASDTTYYAIWYTNPKINFYTNIDKTVAPTNDSNLASGWTKDTAVVYDSGKIASVPSAGDRSTKGFSFDKWVTLKEDPDNAGSYIIDNSYTAAEVANLTFTADTNFFATWKADWTAYFAGEEQYYNAADSATSGNGYPVEVIKITDDDNSDEILLNKTTGETAVSAVVEDEDFEIVYLEDKDTTNAWTNTAPGGDAGDTHNFKLAGLAPANYPGLQDTITNDAKELSILAALVAFDLDEASSIFQSYTADNSPIKVDADNRQLFKSNIDAANTAALLAYIDSVADSSITLDDITAANTNRVPDSLFDISYYYIGTSDVTDGELAASNFDAANKLSGAPYEAGYYFAVIERKGAIAGDNYETVLKNYGTESAPDYKLATYSLASGVSVGGNVVAGPYFKLQIKVAATLSALGDLEQKYTKLDGTEVDFGDTGSDIELYNDNDLADEHKISDAANLEKFVETDNEKINYLGNIMPEAEISLTFEGTFPLNDGDLKLGNTNIPEYDATADPAQDVYYTIDETTGALTIVLKPGALTPADGSADNGWKDANIISLKVGDDTYKFQARQLVMPKITLNYGNSPYGMIMRDDNIADKETAKEKFNKSNKFVKGYVPQKAQTSLGAIAMKLKYTLQAWGTKSQTEYTGEQAKDPDNIADIKAAVEAGTAYINYDKDDTSLFYFTRTSGFYDPGFTATDSLGNDVATLNRSMSVDIQSKTGLSGMIKAMTFTEVLNGDYSYDESASADPDAASLKSKKIRPGVYKISYTMGADDTLLGEDYTVDRTFVVLSIVGDLDLNASLSISDIPYIANFAKKPIYNEKTVSVDYDGNATTLGITGRLYYCRVADNTGDASISISDIPAVANFAKKALTPYYLPMKSLL